MELESSKKMLEESTAYGFLTEQKPTKNRWQLMKKSTTVSNDDQANITADSIQI